LSVTLKLDQRLAACLGRLESLRKIGFGERLDAEGDLAVQSCLRIFPAKEHAKKTLEPVHRGLLLRGLQNVGDGPQRVRCIELPIGGQYISVGGKTNSSF